MFVNFSPADYNAEETAGSLTYASRVKNIKNKAEKGIDSKEVKMLKAQIRELQQKLLRGSEGGDHDESSASASSDEDTPEASESKKAAKPQLRAQPLQKAAAESDDESDESATFE